MALIVCPECGGTVSDKAEKCPHCGCPQEEFLKENNHNDDKKNNSHNSEDTDAVLVYKWIATQVSRFQISKESITFINEHPEFFLGNERNVRSMGYYVNPNISFNHLEKSISKYNKELIEIVGEVYEIKEAQDGSLTYLFVRDEQLKGYELYYLGVLDDVFTESKVWAYVLPLDIQSTRVIGAASYVELQGNEINTQDIAKEDTGRYINFPLAGKVLRFDERLKEYFELRTFYELQARLLRMDIKEFYEETDNLGTIIEHLPEMVENAMSEMIDFTMSCFYKGGLQMTPETFLKKYYYDSKYSMDYNRIISNVVERYADVIGEKNNLERYRDMQKASRSRWQGGGFGLGGALKGALMAGVLNAGTDFVRSFGDAARQNSDNAYIQGKLRELKNSDYARGQLIGGAYTVVVGIFFAVLNELQEHKLMNSFMLKKDMYDEAKNICEATEQYETDADKKIEGYVNAILKYPYYEKPYRLIYKEVKNTPEEVELFKLLDYFGIQTEMGGINTIIYMDIEEYLDGVEALEDFDYKKANPEQVRVAMEIADTLKEKYDESILRRNWRYSQIHSYIGRIRALEPWMLLDYESTAEKQLPMEDYVFELIKKYISMGYIGKESFSGFLWVDGVDNALLGCEYQSCIELYNYGRHVGNKKDYLLIYENTTFHKGKRGFAIFDDGIVFFESEAIVLFKDIIECKFNEKNNSFILETSKMKYEFEYKFFGSKLLGWISEHSEVDLGDFFTSRVICKIIEHYHGLNKAEQIEKNEEDKMFCTMCGAEIMRSAKFCNYCGAEVKYKKQEEK